MTWKYNSKDNNITVELMKTMLANVNLNMFPVVKPRLKMLSEEHVHNVSLLHDGRSETVFALHTTTTPHLWLYDMVTGTYNKCRVPDLSSPKGMVLVDSDTVVLPDRSGDNCKLHFVKISANLQITPIKVKLIPAEAPSRISVSKGTRELLIGQCESTLVTRR